MKETNKDYKKFIYIGIIIIALGTTILTTLQLPSSLGSVAIAIGGFFFIVGMSKKRKHDKNEDK